MSEVEKEEEGEEEEEDFEDGEKEYNQRIVICEKIEKEKKVWL